MEEALSDLLKFLQIGARVDLKGAAVDHILGFTASPEGIEVLYKESKLLVSLLSLMLDKITPVREDASACLVNISANEKGAAALLKVDINADCPPLQLPPKNIVVQCLNQIFDQDSQIADQCCKILSNLSRPKHLIETVVDMIEESDKTFDELIDIFTKTNFNKHNAKLHYLGPFLSNLSQSSRVRKYILDKEKCVIQRLLPFTEYQESMIRRGGIVGTLKNCCFETDYHEWLLSEEVDILPRLLLPLAGPEEFDEEDNEKLPVELQYLDGDKKREEDPDIRCILLEAITLLCSKKINREFVRDKNTYIILRELHKWEEDKKALSACENLVDILIRTEEEIGEDNLRELEIPDHIAEGFNKISEVI